MIVHTAVMNSAFQEQYYTSFCDYVQGHNCDLSMDCKCEQRANIKFCVKLGKTGMETFQMIL